MDAGDFWVLPQSVAGEACSQACAIIESKLELLKVVSKYLFLGLNSKNTPPIYGADADGC